MDCSMPGFPVHHQIPELAQLMSMSQWWHPTMSTSVIPFSSCLQSFSTSWSFPMSQFFASGGQSIGASVSASVLPMNVQDWFPLGWTGLISLQSRDSQEYSLTLQFKSINSSTLSHSVCPIVCGPMDYSLPDSSAHEIFQARILE